MVVTDLNVICIAILEAKTYAPLIIDRNRMLAFTIAGQFMQSISRRRSKIFQGGGKIDIFQLSRRTLRNICCKAGGFAGFIQVLSALVGKCLDHSEECNASRDTGQPPKVPIYAIGTGID